MVQSAIGIFLGWSLFIVGIFFGVSLIQLSANLFGFSPSGLMKKPALFGYALVALSLFIMVLMAKRFSKIHEIVAAYISSLLCTLLILTTLLPEDLSPGKFLGRTEHSPIAYRISLSLCFILPLLITTVTHMKFSRFNKLCKTSENSAA